MGKAASDRFFLAMILTVALVFLLSATARFTNGALKVSAWTGTFLAPVQGVLSGGAFVFDHATGYVTSLIQAQSELQLVETQNSYLKGQVFYDRNAQNQVTELKSLLRLANSSALQGKTVAADVVARDPAAWFESVTIDRGSRQGVRPGDAVLSDQGLAGRVIATTPLTSEILLLPDPQSSLGAMDSRTREVGVVSGTGDPGQITLQFYSGFAKVKVGDAIVSSGLAGPIPKGLAIGRVVKVGRASFGLVKYATVIPYVDFNRLEYVLVVTGP